MLPSNTLRESEFWASYWKNHVSVTEASPEDRMVKKVILRELCENCL